jgi:hypothetical protein
VTKNSLDKNVWIKFGSSFQRRASRLREILLRYNRVQSSRSFLSFSIQEVYLSSFFRVFQKSS